MVQTKPNKDRVLKGTTFNMQIIKSNIVHVLFKPDSLSKKEDIELCYDMYYQITENQKSLILFELSQYSTLDNTARDYLDKTKLNAIAVAIIIKSLPQRILYNFYKTFRKQAHPLKSFNDKEAAIKWLKSI